MISVKALLSFLRIDGLLWAATAERAKTRAQDQFNGLVFSQLGLDKKPVQTVKWTISVFVCGLRWHSYTPTL